MNKQMMALVVAAACALPGPAVAQDGGSSYTWLAFSMTKEGKLQDALRATIQNDAPLLDKLLADGTIISWGILTPVNHHRGRFDANIGVWVTASSWANIGKWADAVGQAMATMSPEDQAKAMAQGAELYEPRSHYDQIVANPVYKPSTEQRPAYFYSTTLKAKPGQSGELVQVFKDFIVPLADGLTSRGALAGYGLQQADLMGDQSWSHRAWWALPNLGALDELRAAIAAGMTPAIGARTAASSEWDGRQHDLMMVLHLGGR